MTNNLIARLTTIFNAITIHSPTSLSFATQTISQQYNFQQPLSYPLLAENSLVSQLANCLYQYGYSNQFTGVISDESSMAPDHQNSMIQDETFLQALSEANNSRERWDPGWQIYQINPSGEILAHKSGTRRSLWPGEFISEDGVSMGPRVGAYIRIFSAKESKTMQTGFYFAFSEIPLEMHNLVRIYWSVKVSGAVRLLQLITQSFNRFQIPFRYKCLNNPALFNRLDAAVLFVNKRFHKISLELLVDIYPQISNHVKSHVPLFTKRLAPGLSLAEEPGNGESFGMHRCRILAEGILNAYIKSGSQTVNDRQRESRILFERYGLDFDKPYLNAGSFDCYEFSQPNI